MRCPRGDRVCARVEPDNAIDEEREYKKGNEGDDDQESVIEGMDHFHDRGCRRLKPDLPRLRLRGRGHARQEAQGRYDRGQPH